MQRIYIFLSCRPASLQLRFPFSFLLFFFIFCRAGLHFFLFARVLIAVGIAWPKHLACSICNVCVCPVVCGHRARLSVRRQRGHWLC